MYQDENGFISDGLSVTLFCGCWDWEDDGELEWVSGGGGTGIKCALLLLMQWNIFFYFFFNLKGSKRG